MRRTTGYT